MESKFNELRLTFNGIKDIREEINNIFINLEQRVVKLKDIYKEFINNNNTTLFIFGLDSFYFQNKLIDIEFSDMKRFYDLIMNRTYCEYYKLYKIILDYGNTHLSDDSKFLETIQKKMVYPAYKDLEPYKKYDFHLIDEIHDDIVNVLIAMNNYLTNKKHLLASYKMRSDVGLNINNFVSTYEFEVSSIDSQMALFCSYVDFFHELHLKYLKRFITKIQILYGQINHDIKFDEVLLNNKSDKKKFMTEMKGEIDKKTMRELRSSIHIDNIKGDLSSDSDEEQQEQQTQLVKEEEHEEKEHEIENINHKIQSILDNSHNQVRTASPSIDVPFMSLALHNNNEHFDNIIIDDNIPLAEPKLETHTSISTPPINPIISHTMEIEEEAKEDVNHEVSKEEEVKEAEVKEEAPKEGELSVDEGEKKSTEDDDDWLGGFTEVKTKKGKGKKNKNKK